MFALSSSSNSKFQRIFTHNQEASVKREMTLVWINFVLENKISLFIQMYRTAHIMLKKYYHYYYEQITKTESRIWLQRPPPNITKILATI